ncbi:NifU family protein [Rhizomicrobium electricum]|uniref:NIF system FeS cluster assembly NifU C-terminal domain-containing protein n=1 Tax=Rhizomicrobium electricum TaxID=480070 RepID=A0ABP3Q726_9PROT|nr:NifU family protein [Rhizomicrobium electricum]NIJ50357.1 Fe-S cluster biogenesis protein NfuA [Rhizomicrobium electricum]
MDRAVEDIPTAPVDLETEIAKAIADLRPVLQRDGGDIELVAVEGDIVVVDFKGACSGCVLASVTLAGVRKRLIDAIGHPLKVVPRSAMALIGKEVAA